MNRGRARVLSLGLFSLGVGAFLASIAFLVTGFAEHENPANDIPFVILLLFWGALGVLLVSRVPDNSIGWLFIGMSLVTQITFLAQMHANSSGRGRAYSAWFDSWAADWLPPLLVVLLLLLFPSGRFGSRLEKFTAGVMGGVVLSAMAATALRPGPFDRHEEINPFGVESLDGVLSTIVSMSGPAMTLVFLLTIASMFTKLRRSSGIQRQQLKWFFLAAALLAFDLVLASIAGAAGVDGGVGDVLGAALFFIGLSGLAVAITVAILRYRLYDIDLLINRALVYGTLTALIVLVYIGSIFAVQSFLDPFANDSDLAVAASTLAVAALVRPLRAHIQAFVDRRFYRRKYDSARTLDEMSFRLRQHVAMEAVQKDVLTAVHDTVQPAHASLWLRGGPV